MTDDTEREALNVASPDTWSWDHCIVCGSDNVTDRGVIVVVSKAEGVFLARLGWCDSSEECRADLRQAGASILTPDDTEAFDAALRHSEAPEPSVENMRQVQYDDGSWSRTLEGSIPSRDEQDAETMNAVTHQLRRISKSPEPQGEPSDAQVVAAVDAFMASQLESEDGPTLVHKNMLAALRAALSLREGGAR